MTRDEEEFLLEQMDELSARDPEPTISELEELALDYAAVERAADIAEYAR